MKAIKLLSLILFVIINNIVLAQNKSFSVEKASFSSSVGDDFSPVFYKNGLVFCSNSIATAAVSIKSDNENLFSLLFAEQRDSGIFRSPELFSNELTTILNEGPATFSPDGNIIYFARNNLIEGKFKAINKPSNKLGIYKAELINGIWTNISPFPYNDPEYSFGTPALSADGNRLYFASDKPGGYGGIDIYYCENKNGNWEKPVNMGRKVNTSGDEAYPFACASGRLFFSSNGHSGFGGKDIFYTYQKDGDWINPIHLENDINSEDDDFGIITDINFEYGFFSSNRKSNTDIYSFKTKIPQLGMCEPQTEFNQCFQFFDERYTDTLYLQHEWNFGNGIIKKGLKVEQCFNSPGKYTAVLTITHTVADSVYKIQSEYPFEVKQDGTEYILSENAGIVNQSIEFSALGTEQKNISAYYWDCLEGYSIGEIEINRVFSKSGEYEIKLGLEEPRDSKGIIPRNCISKKINIFDDYQQLAAYNNTKSDSFSTQKSISSDLNTNSYQIINYYIGKFEGQGYSILNEKLDSISKFTLNLDDNNNLLSGALKLLDIYIEILNSNPDIKLEIAVHRNNKENSKYNNEVTGIVAANIKNYASQRIINNSRINCLGYGDSRPLPDWNEEHKKNTNNRIEFILINNNPVSIK